MSIFQFLKLQPLEPSDDGTVSDLDQYEEDETLDLTKEVNSLQLNENWEHLIHDNAEDPDRVVFADGE